MIRALVVDDDLLNREIARRMLGRLGLLAEEAPGGARAAEMVRRAGEEGRPFAIVFVDLTMPGLDGCGTARLLRSQGYGGRLYALSGGEEGPDTAGAGFDGFIQKPADMEALKAAVFEAGVELPLAFPAGAWTEAGSLFRFCPSCGSPRLATDRGRRWICPDCGFEYFHNVATAAGIVIETSSGVILLERAREPEAGKLCLPGGFVEPGERAEDAAVRECREELGWAPAELEFLASYPNLYRYKGVPYATCDLYFRSMSAPPDPASLDPDRAESRGLRVAPFDGFPWAEIAFESARRALRRYFRLPDRPGPRP